ncbi:MAG: deoxyribonuclease IV [Candidatus Lambdaproteobacteria bacterium]|nr:deoxyribonuclease IV [Candidatus Lambdaproteobacteria bacterium]
MARKARQREGDLAREMLIGPHVSVAGALANAIANGERVGATCIQIFTRNQRTWQVKPLGAEEAAAFRAAWAGSAIREVMSHDSYLINLGSPDPALLERSRRAFAEEVQRCVLLGIRLLNFHPGAHGTGERGASIARIAESVRGTMAAFPAAPVIYTLENTAGQGTVIGSTLEELAILLEALDAPERSGVCLDTCHLFAAGYDILSDEGWARFWEEFERRIGFRYLKAFHVNDALRPLGSRLDRHERLGAGQLGMGFFARLAADPRFFAVPMFLETPGGDDVWREEVATLRALRAGTPAARSRKVIARGRPAAGS